VPRLVTLGAQRFQWQSLPEKLGEGWVGEPFTVTMVEWLIDVDWL